RPTASIDISHQTVTWHDASHVYTLPPAQIAMFEQAFSISAAAGNTNTGSINWNYNITDSQLDFLAAAESITVTVPVIIDDHHGGSISQDVLVTLNGANDNPKAAADSNGIAKGSLLSVAAANGVLANESDPDIHDQ